MNIRVDVEKCTGCGACVEVCPTGAIHLDEGLAVLDQAICSQCQACADTCPTGAIVVVELPIVAELQPVQPAGESRVVVKEPIPYVQEPWHSTLLAFAGREILPRVIDMLLSTLERRLAASQSTRAEVHLLGGGYARLAPLQDRGRGKKLRKRYGQAINRLGHGAGGRK